MQGQIHAQKDRQFLLLMEESNTIDAFGTEGLGGKTLFLGCTT